MLIYSSSTIFISEQVHLDLDSSFQQIVMREESLPGSVLVKNQDIAEFIRKELNTMMWDLMGQFELWGNSKGSGTLCPYYISIIQPNENYSKAE